MKLLLLDAAAGPGSGHERIVGRRRRLELMIVAAAALHSEFEGPWPRVQPSKLIDQSRDRDGCNWQPSCSRAARGHPMCKGLVCDLAGLRRAQLQKINPGPGPGEPLQLSLAGRRLAAK